MTKEERKQKAIEYLNSHMKYHTETSYGGDCQVYEHNSKVVDIFDAKYAIDIALGE